MFKIKHLGYTSFARNRKTGKRTTKRPVKSIKQHIKYIERDRPDKHRNKPILFNAERDEVSRHEFYKKLNEQPKKGVVAHKFVFSLSEDERNRNNLELKEMVRETIRAYEEKYKTQLDWVGAVHDDPGHPHVHVVIRGRDLEGKQVYIRPERLQVLQKIAEQTKERHVERNLQRGLNQERDLFRELEREHERIPVPERSRGLEKERELELEL